MGNLLVQRELTELRNRIIVLEKEFNQKLLLLEEVQAPAPAVEEAPAIETTSSAKINVLLGKEGTGKTYNLRLSAHLHQQERVLYLSDFQSTFIKKSLCFPQETKILSYIHDGDEVLRLVISDKATFDRVLIDTSSRGEAYCANIAWSFAHQGSSVLIALDGSSEGVLLDDFPKNYFGSYEGDIIDLNSI